jgi:hypothetical protein
MKIGGDWELSIARPPVGVCTSIKFSNSAKPAPAAQLDSAAVKAGVSIPLDYRAFLLLHNGGRPKPNRFKFRRSTEIVDELFSFRPKEGWRSVLELYQGHIDVVENGPDLRAQLHLMLVIGKPDSDEDCLAIAGGHDHFGEVFYQPYIEGLQRPIRIAKSFAEFLALIEHHRK